VTSTDQLTISSTTKADPAWFLCAVSEAEVTGELEKGRCTIRQISESAVTVVTDLLLKMPSCYAMLCYFMICYVVMCEDAGPAAEQYYTLDKILIS